MAEQEEEVQEPEKSRRFMANPNQWPHIVLPVKRPSWEVGVMFDERPRVYTVNMMELGKYNNVHPDKIPHLDYDDLQAVVDDGWRVD